MRKTVSFVIVVFVFISSVQAAEEKTSTDWPNWRGPRHNGISNEINWQSGRLLDDPKILWRASVGTGFSSMSVSGGRVYTMGNTGKKGDKKEKEHKDIVYCLNAKTGREIWRHEYNCRLDPQNYEGGPSATPTVNGEEVYTLSKAGDVFCLNSTVGKVIWQRQLARELGIKPPRWGFASSPLVMGQRLILNAGTNGVALDKMTGRVLWQNGKTQAGYATAVHYKTGNVDCVAIFGARAMYGIRVEDGRQLWQFPWKTRYDENIPDPIIIDTPSVPHSLEIFITSGMGTGCARLKLQQNSSIKQIWRNKSMCCHLNSSILWQGYLYGFDDSKFKCVDYQDGQEKWAADDLGKGSLMMTFDGRMIILSEKGKLIIAPATPEKYHPIAQARILQGRCWTVPVLSGGRIYARNARGDLVCVDVSGK
ncbi:MAG: PQQ-binding-like beta-propeller repeat protein [Sedimentisphaerales bacterium]|nr:PQQ-binding-like beta-propeller repeat protein [Sedimentisphaerales bacterium]